MEKLTLSLKRKELKVALEGTDGKISNYILRELSGKGRGSYLNSISSKMNYDSKGNPRGLKNYDGLHSALLVRTLFREDGTSLSEEDIQEFPTSTCSALFNESQKQNALDEESAKEVKND